MQLQESGEMYLETIYILSQTSSAVRSLDVAEYMGFSKPSVSRAVGLLKQNGYLQNPANRLPKKSMSATPYSRICSFGLAWTRKLLRRMRAKWSMPSAMNLLQPSNGTYNNKA